MILMAAMLVLDLFFVTWTVASWKKYRGSQTNPKDGDVFSILTILLDSAVAAIISVVVERWAAPIIDPVIKALLTPAPPSWIVVGMISGILFCLTSCALFSDTQLRKIKEMENKSYSLFVAISVVFIILGSLHLFILNSVVRLASPSTLGFDPTIPVSGPAASWTASPASPKIASWPDSAATVPTMPSGQGGVWLKGGPLDVYTGPGRSYYKDGKAQVGTNDTVELLAYDNGWLLIEYNVNSGGRRRGYVPEDSIDYKKNDNRTQSIIRNDLPKARITATARVHLNCYDDLTMVRMPFYQIREGTEVEVLASTVFPAPRNEWAYIEYTSKEIRLRAFVLLSDLEF